MTLNRTPIRSPQAMSIATSNAPGDTHWYAATNLRIAAGTTWTMPVPFWRDVRGHLAGFLTTCVDSATVGETGSLRVRIETAVVKSNATGAWRSLGDFVIDHDVAGGSGMADLILGRQPPLLGWLRMSIDAMDADVTISFHTLLVLKQPVAYRAYDWFSSQILLAPGGQFTLPLDLAVDACQFMNAYMAVQFDPTPDGTSHAVSVQLETTPALRPANWLALRGVGAVPDSGKNTVVLTSARTVDQMVPSGILRFTVANDPESSPTQGFLQTWLLLKQS